MIPQYVQNVLDSAYRRYAMTEPIPRVGMFGPFPSSFLLTVWHGTCIMSRLLAVGGNN